MNLKQKKFAQYFVQCGNAAESARKAGYSASYAGHRANEMLVNVEIAEYINELNNELENACILTAKQRQEMLSDIARDDNNQPSDRIKALDTLNKMTGEYVTQIAARVETSEKLSDVFKQIGGEGLEE